MLIDGIQVGYVNGFCYNQVLPAPDAEIPERFQRAEQVVAQKLWREQLRDWDEKWKPTSMARHRELQSVNPDALSDAEWAEYLFMRDNPKGWWTERWYHVHGCRRWFDLERDTSTNEIRRGTT